MSTERLKALPEHLRERTRALNSAPIHERAQLVLYWMRTAVRAHENPALDVAIEVGNALGLPVLVYHAVSERYRYASDRHHTFIMEGARDVSAQLLAAQIAYAFHCERPGHRGPHLKTLAQSAALVLTEDMPVYPLREWTRHLADQLSTAFWAVDTACVVPMRVVGQPLTRAFAYRKRITPLIAPRLKPWPQTLPKVSPERFELPFEPVDWSSASIADLVAQCNIDHTVGPVFDTPGGSTAGYARWADFAQNGLKRYAKLRNDPAKRGVSRLSPYLHYGMVAPTRIAREASQQGADKFLDELIVWREMAYTWCLYSRSHEDLNALPVWAQETLRAHADDPRPETFDLETLERGQTGHALWDLCQRSLRAHGELHNNVRMTWGKAIPGWTEDPQAALDALIDLNHRFALDGRDPASYGGLLWCLGQFDRPFPPERPVLGSVRARSMKAHARRLDLEAFAQHIDRPPFAAAPRIGVIGAGLAGAICARTLQDHNLEVVLLDKGRRPSGRLASRARPDGSFDFGAQYFTARDPRLARSIEAWKARGLIAPWSGPFVRLDKNGSSEAAVHEPRYVGVPSMDALVAHLLEGLDVRFEQRAREIRPAGSGAQVILDGAALHFDLVLVATPAPQAAALLGAWPTLARRLEAVRVAPCWALMAKMPEGLGLTWGGARAKDDVISWIARDRTKPGRPSAETWVVHASADWSKVHLEESREEVEAALMEAAQRLTGINAAPLELRAHRWRYALVEEPVGEDCLLEAPVGVCGDGLLGGRVEAALLSGTALAGRVLGALRERAST